MLDLLKKEMWIVGTALVLHSFVTLLTGGGRGALRYIPTALPAARSPPSKNEKPYWEKEKNTDARDANTRTSGFERLVPYAMKASPRPSQFMITAGCQGVKLKEA